MKTNWGWVSTFLPLLTGCVSDVNWEGGKVALYCWETACMTHCSVSRVVDSVAVLMRNL